MSKHIRITSNVMKKEELKDQIFYTLKEIADIVGETLGPYGATTLVQDRSLEHTISKDGYSVLKQIMLKEDVPRTILDISRNISQTQVRMVGDGSTSSIIVAFHLYSSLFYSNKFNDISQTEMIAMLNYLRDELEMLIKAASNKITLENKFEVLSKIATISTNNDLKIGKFVASVFDKLNKESFIDIKLGKTLEHTFELSKGFEVNRGIIDTAYINQTDKKTCKLKDVLTLHIEGKVTVKELSEIIYPALEYAQGEEKHIAIVANGYDHESRELLRKVCLSVKQQSEFRLAAIDMSLASPDSIDKFHDLETYLDALSIDPMDKNQAKFDINMLGYCKEFISVNGVTRFIETRQNKERLDARKAEIQDKIDELTNMKQGMYDIDSVIVDLKRRLVSLDQSIAIIYVGGNNPTERETTQYLIEDAVYACKSALEYGYIIGGNLTIPRLIVTNIKPIANNIIDKMQKEYNSDIDGNTLIDVILAVGMAFSQSFKTVLSKYYSDEESTNILNQCVNTGNIFNLKTKKYESIENSAVINSAMTDIQIMFSCFSLIGLLGTSNQFLSTSFIDNDIEEDYL